MGKDHGGGDQDRLVLLEFIVNSIQFSKTFNENENDAEATRNLFIHFQLLNHITLSISVEEKEKENVKRGKDEVEKISVNSGKSCLFPASTSDKITPCSDFEIVISQKIGCRKEAIVGKATVGISTRFTDVFNGCIEGSESLRGVYDIRDCQCRVCGKVEMTIRVSNFGDLLVTPYLEEGCKEKSKNSQLNNDSTVTIVNVRDEVQPCTKGEQMKLECPATKKKKHKKANSCPSPNIFSNQYRRVDPMNLPEFPPNFPYCQKIIVGESESSSSEEEEEPPVMPQMNFCSCDFPIPPQFHNPPCSEKPKKKKKKPKKEKFGCPFEIAPGEYCMKENCPCGLTRPPWYTPPPPPPPPKNFHLEPGSVGVKNSQVIFQLDECEPIHLDETKKMKPQLTEFKVETSPHGPVNCIELMHEPPTSWPLQEQGREIYLLRMSKRSESGHKANMEIELRVPKIPDSTPDKVDHQTQYETEKKSSKGNAKKSKKGKKK